MKRNMMPRDDSARSEDPARRPGPAKVVRIGQQSQRVIRAEAGVVSERLTALIHELSSLLDGSLRHVSLMSGVINRAAIEPGQEHELERRLGVIRGALEQMAVCVDHAAGREKRAWLTPGTINEAVGSAIAIAEPLATERRVEIISEIDERAGRAPAMCIYTIVLNAVRNAVEAIGELPDNGRAFAGRIEVRVVDAPIGSRDGVRISISDNGPGLSAKALRMGVGAPGATTKRGHLGVGLALVRELVEQRGGWMDLHHRDNAPGACLSVWLPSDTPRLPALPPGNTTT
jgi:signal transduction histidine kinase